MCERGEKGKINKKEDKKRKFAPYPDLETKDPAFP